MDHCHYCGSQNFIRFHVQPRPGDEDVEVRRICGDCQRVQKSPCDCVKCKANK